MKRDYIILIVLILFFSCTTNGQEDVLITKFRTYYNSDNRVKEIYYTGNHKYLEKNYAFNGWQVYDSIVFDYDDANSSILYEPQYNDTLRKITKYLKRKDLHIAPSIYQLYFENLLNDKYDLTRDYINDFVIIFDLMKKDLGKPKFDDEVNTNFIPTVLMNYGIPYDALLDSCSYHITKNGLLKNDNFYFQKYTIHRDFYYDGLTLKNVDIIKIDKENNTKTDFKEKFRVTKTEKNDNR